MTPFAPFGIQCSVAFAAKWERLRQLRMDKMRRLVQKLGLIDSLQVFAECMPSEEARANLSPTAYDLCNQLTADGEMGMASHLSELAMRAISRARRKLLEREIGDIEKRVDKLEGKPTAT